MLKKTTFLIVLFFSFFGIINSLQAQGNENEFVQKALTKLSQGKLINNQPAILHNSPPIYNLYSRYKRLIDDTASLTKGRNDSLATAYIGLCRKITELSIEEDIYFDPLVRTKKPDAVIKYQSIYEREAKIKPHQSKSLSSSTLHLPMGVYYIWSERGSATTSDKNRDINVDDGSSIEIVEQE